MNGKNWLSEFLRMRGAWVTMFDTRSKLQLPEIEQHHIMAKPHNKGNTTHNETTTPHNDKTTAHNEVTSAHHDNTSTSHNEGTT